MTNVFFILIAYKIVLVINSYYKYNLQIIIYT